MSPLSMNPPPLWKLESEHPAAGLGLLPFTPLPKQENRREDIRNTRQVVFGQWTDL